MIDKTTLVTLDEAKRQLNIDSTWNGDDTYITDCINDAIDIVARDADRLITELLDENGKLVAPAKRATLMKIGDMYAYRESVVQGTMSSVPNGYNALIGMIKKW